MDISPARPRRSIRTPKRKEDQNGYKTQPPKKSHRSCGKAGCPNERPSCFAKATSGCAKDGYTSRWYHISDREHFCNECFEYSYRSYKEGNQRYTDWKLKTAALFLKEVSLKLFFAEEILDYWTICSECRKWRKVDDSIISEGTIQPWQCSKVDGGTCQEDEPKEVAEARNLVWMDSLSYSPLLKYTSPFAVLNEYYLDGIGFSTVSTSTADATEGSLSNIQPFYKPGDAEKFGCFAPDVMLSDEEEAFPELVKHRSVFLGLRNMAVSLWNSSYKEYLSLQTCMSHLVIRGLTRITLCELLKRVLDFLTVKGRINFGIMSKIPSGSIFNTEHFKCSVIVIGAGFAGLSAALRLKRAGCQVTVLEARNEIGGRVKDDRSLGICVSQGPQIISGCVNNPVYIMCKQMNLPLRMLRPKCTLINGKGEVANESIEQKVEFYFNLMLESIDELKETENVLNNKLSLKDCLAARTVDLEAQIFRELSEEENQLLQFHLGNLEYECGAPLDHISALHWNQNESMQQFGGAHAWVEAGFTPLIESFGKILDPQLGCEVTDIDFSGDQVKVTDHAGKEYTADKAVVAVPLSALKKETIQFTPALPDAKKSSISNLGVGITEKVMLAFEKNFWRERVGQSDYFGRIPEGENDRGLACLFCDVSAKEKHALIAHIAGDAVSQLKNLSDAEIIDRCMEKLRSMFPNEDIPAPYKYFVSHWGREEHVEMAFSYVGTNGSGVDYDNLAEVVDGKLYFAGEATIRRFPQTVTGAFISGLREAEKILLSRTDKTDK